MIDHALTRPWGKVQKLFRKTDPHQVWLAETCPEDNVWIKIGDEAYYRNVADGKLMPARPNQPPPDLSYFKKPAK